ncbi:Uncharacterised protein [Mycobacteroides abscessus subsp. abscessus]|nr:Uncharacterised protein [Mycobacteroides abscessus subsp. abscessus]
MHHEPVAGVVLDAVVGDDLPALRHVVLLVEDGSAAIGERAKVDEPGQCRYRCDDGGHHPAPETVGGPEVRGRYPGPGRLEIRLGCRGRRQGCGRGHTVDRRGGACSAI